jgi:hypothetical protein
MIEDNILLGRMEWIKFSILLLRESSDFRVPLFLFKEKKLISLVLYNEILVEQNNLKSLNH